MTPHAVLTIVAQLMNNDVVKKMLLIKLRIDSGRIFLFTNHSP